MHTLSGDAQPPEGLSGVDSLAKATKLAPPPSLSPSKLYPGRTRTSKQDGDRPTDTGLWPKLLSSVALKSSVHLGSSGVAKPGLLAWLAFSNQWLVWLET